METLSATLTITEDMASDGGVLTAARFQWLVGKYVVRSISDEERSLPWKTKTSLDIDIIPCDRRGPSIQSTAEQRSM